MLAQLKVAPVAQLDRVSDYESEGRRFESCLARILSCGPKDHKIKISASRKLLFAHSFYIFRYGD